MGWIYGLGLWARFMGWVYGLDLWARFMGWVYGLGLWAGFMGWVYGLGLWAGFMGWVQANLALALVPVPVPVLLSSSSAFRGPIIQGSHHPIVPHTVRGAGPGTTDMHARVSLHPEALGLPTLLVP